MVRATKVARLRTDPVDYVTLDYEARYTRRIVMKGQKGLTFLLDLQTVTRLQDGDDLMLEDDRHVRVLAASESLLKISAVDGLQLMKIVWHIGNRHMPCAIRGDCVLIRKDHVVADMIKTLGGQVIQVEEPFEPEGGAYQSESRVQ